MPIKIKSMRTSKPTKPWHVKCDRSSSLGNPFKGKREDTCKQYAVYFKEEIVSGKNAPALQELRRLYHLHTTHSKLELYCWCAPLQCHTETIKAFLDEKLFISPLSCKYGAIQFSDENESGHNFTCDHPNHIGEGCPLGRICEAEPEE